MAGVGTAGDGVACRHLVVRTLMPVERVLPRKGLAAQLANVGLDAKVQLGVAVAVVLARELLVADVAAKRSLGGVCASMRLEVVRSRECLVATGKVAAERSW